LYPWGDETPSCTLATLATDAGDGCGTGTTAPVGSRRDGDSFFGVADMSGNVIEWTFDVYSMTYYATSPTVDPSGPAEGPNRTLRGSAFTVPEDFLRPHRVSQRTASSPDSQLTITGIRCARSD
jgi:formylglycine-generating enzyme required for sulfatase activity